MTVTFSTNETIINWTSSDDPAVTFQVVKIAGGTGGGGAPTAHASTHQDGGSDELALDASQTTSGVFNVARLGTGTSDVYHFLDGSGTWTDNVPVLIPCKNTSGGSIAKGAPVYVTGNVGATYVVEIAAADADTAAKMPAIGLLESTLANNATGYIVATGVLQGIDTSGYAINDTLYVSTTAGQLTATKPSGASDLIQNIARVTRVNSSTGSVVVLGAGRTNDVPNAIDAGKLTSGTVATARLGTGTASASTFLRGDASWAAAGDNTLPFAANDYWLLSRGNGTGYTSTATSSNIANSNSTGKAQPFYVGKQIQVDALACYCAVKNGGSGGVVRMGIYSDSSGRPGTVVQDAGTQSIVATGIKTATFTAVTLNPGWYWAVLVPQTLDSTTAGVTNPQFAAASSLTATIGETTPTASNAMLPSAVFAAAGALANNPTVTILRGDNSSFHIWMRVSTP